MRLHLFRHAIALSRNDPSVDADQERPLTEEGRQQARQAAQGIRSLGIHPDRIATSPFVRARQTATAACRAFELTDDAIVESDHLTPDSEPADTRKAMRELGPAEAVLVVGHKPHLPRFAAALLTGGPEGADLALPKASLCSIEIALGTPEALGQLQRLLRADELRMLART